MKRSLKLKDIKDEEDARIRLTATDIDILRKLEKNLSLTDPLVVEREALRQTIRKGKRK